MLFCDNCAKEMSGQKQVFMWPPTDKAFCSKDCIIAYAGAWDYHDAFECNENCDCHDPLGVK